MDTTEGFLVEEKARRAEWTQIAADAVAEFNVVRSLPEHPGWLVMMNVLHGIAKDAREKAQNLFDELLTSETKESKEAYMTARIQLLALEQAIQLYAQIRERAQNGKNYLDKLPPEGLAS